MRKTLCFAALAAVLSTAALAATPDVPEAVRPPAGHKMTLHTVGAGEITYECRQKADAADAYEWAFVAPVATLADKDQKTVGKYYAGPTWEAADGSKVTGKQHDRLRLRHAGDDRTAANRPCSCFDRSGVPPMTDPIAHNLHVVDRHIRNEAVDVDSVLEVPGRDLRLEGKAAIRANYLAMFASMTDVELEPLDRFATPDRVVDDMRVRCRLTGPGLVNAPVPVGSRVEIRLIHHFAMRDGKICREQVFELWRAL